MIQLLRNNTKNSKHKIIMNIPEQQLKRSKPVVLAILDGWGVTQPYSGNAITQANTPVMNGLVSRYPAVTLRASGEAVGLPWGEPGNSEVGHLNIGLGRILYQDLPRINKSIIDNSFYQNQTLIAACDHAIKNKSKLHIMGLVSNGGVHSSMDHLQALVVLAKEKNIEKLYIHAFLDGRDTAYNSAANFIRDMERFMAEYKIGKIATVSGRFYAMDRDSRWNRIEKAYNAIVLGEGNKSESAIEAIEESYKKKIYDEEFVPTVITSGGKPIAKIEDGDAIIFFNFRSDRARELTKAFVIPDFDKFGRAAFLKNLFFATFTQYERGLPVEVVFPYEKMNHTLGETLAKNGLTQLRIAETEKYAHVTYFFNGGKEEKNRGEDHELVPSLKISSYDMKPEMSAPEIAKKIVDYINQDKYDFILVNFANPDMVGHTGNLAATIKAVEEVDKCLGKIVKTALSKEGIVFVTADHGNAESKFNMQTGTIDKEHTANPVPFIIIGKQFEGLSLGSKDAPGGDLSLLQPQGILSDIAPTILKVMGLPKPKEMTGISLI